MKILQHETFNLEMLLDGVRRTPLRGFGGAKPFVSADLRLERHADPNEFSPAQNYVLRDGIARIVSLRDALAGCGIDLFDLAGGVWVWTDERPDLRVPVIPPVIERSREPDGRDALLISDGLHRVYAARSLGERISAVSISDVAHEYPYYAFPLDGGWEAVLELDGLPDGHQKKNYRQPDNYKALFRDYNSVFPGVQEQRKKSNPGHLTA
jgi:hypothetical protein